MLRDAEVERRSLDAEAEQRRRLVEEQFEELMAQRRADDDRKHAEREAESKAEAARRVCEGADEAERLVAKATVQADEVRHLRQAIAERLLGAQKLLRQAGPAWEVRGAVDAPTALQRQACVRAGSASSDGLPD